MSRLHGDGLGQPIAGIGVSGPQAYTPTVTWPGNTITTQSGFFLKLPGLLLVWVTFVESAGTATAVCTITIPTGYTAVSMAGAVNTGVGSMCRGDATVAVFPIIAAPGATTSISTAVGLPGAVATWAGYFAIPTLT